MTRPSLYSELPWSYAENLGIKAHLIQTWQKVSWSCWCYYMAKCPFSSSCSDHVQPSGSPILPISSNVAKEDLGAAQIYSAEEGANAPGAAELSCHAPSGQVFLLVSSSCQSCQPWLNPLEGHLKVAWEGNVDNRETYVTSGVLRENSTSSGRQN